MRTFLAQFGGVPGEVAVVDAERAVLHIPAAAADGADALGAHLAQGRRSSHLVLALLLVDVPAAAGLPVLVARVPRDAHGGNRSRARARRAEARWRGAPGPW